MDFVMFWVDSNDPVWIEQYTSFKAEVGQKGAVRFRDWDNLRYWFRGVEAFAPWVDKIHFITSGHYPEWINKDHPKLNLVKHADYIPAQYLPTFNSSMIELYLHLLEGLSNEFVLFNDDFFIINNVLPERFFRKNLPCDIAVLNALSYGKGIGHNILNSIDEINHHFSKRKVISGNILKWINYRYKSLLFRTFCLLAWPDFTGFFDPHLPQPFLKNTFRDVWASNVIKEESLSRFRNEKNFTQYLFRYWQLAKGEFYPINPTNDSVYFTLNDENIQEACCIIKSRKKSIIVLNDADDIDFEQAKYKINNSLESILPLKSNFEI